MKRIFLGLTALLLVTAAFIFNACEKQEIMENNQQDLSQTDPTLQKILNFKSTVENPTKAGGETMSIDSAVWYIEALLNFEYCVIEDSTEIYAESGQDSIISDVVLENDRISTQEVVDKYFEIENELQKQLSEIKEENKRVDIVDVSYINGQFKTYSLFNYGEQLFGGKYLYNITGHWYWGWDYGKCDGTQQGKDLASEIKKWLGYNRGVLANVTWTDVETTEQQFVCHEGSLDDFPFLTNLISYNGVNMFNHVNPLNEGYICVTNYFCNAYAQGTNIALDVIEDYYLDPGYKVKSVGEIYEWCYLHSDGETGTYVHELRPLVGIPISGNPSER